MNKIKYSNRTAISHQFITQFEVFINKDRLASTVNGLYFDIKNRLEYLAGSCARPDDYSHLQDGSFIILREKVYC